MGKARQLHDGQLEFRNNIAIAGWAFMALWVGLLILFTTIFFTKGGFGQYDPVIEWGVLCLVWLFGLGGCKAFFGTARVRLRIANGQVTVREAWLFRRSTETFPVKAMSEPRFLRERDSDGDPYFRCRLTTPSGRSVTVSESNDEQAVLDVCRKLKDAAEK